MEEKFDKILQFQEAELASMRSISAELYAALNLNETEFLTALRDKNNHTPSEWASLERNRSLLKKELEKRFLATKTKNLIHKNSPIQPHWIFVR